MAEYVCDVVTEHELCGDVHHYVRRERVVRCRDCKHYRPSEDDEHEDGCALAYAYLFETSPDGFCAWGERSE